MTTIVLALVLACGGAPEAPQPPPPAPLAEAPAPAPEAKPVEAWKVLAPSPLELEAEVRAAGVADSLAAQVPAEMPAMPPAEEKDRVAFRTGAVFAYTLLGGRTSEKAVLIAQVRSIRDGMATIGTGQGLLDSMDRAVTQIENDTASRDDFLAEIDAQVSTSVPEEGWGPDDTTGPMLQAGAWLAGINLTAKAVVAKGDLAAADKLLKRGEVATFFLEYLKSEEGSEKAGILSGKVAETLTTLQTLSAKPTLTLEDAEATVAATDTLMRLL